jgi:RHH-type transcriptional regulator, proline utilization regulon repressor / proline dehydrogenase / delta 1-pyrroline-5-carboxylate dehydrogenase
MILNDNVYRRPLIEEMIQELAPLSSQRSEISARATAWVNAVRETPLSTFNIQRFLQDFPLTHHEGRSLMSLSEAFLRIPDSYTATLLLKDKLSGHTWRKGGEEKASLLSVSRWGLDLVNFLQSKSWGSFAQPFSLKGVKGFMRLFAREFILGRTIEEACKRRLKTPQDRFSFDMLGEGARTFSTAKEYLTAYRHAIKTLGEKKGPNLSFFERDSISIKLSALHPHYTFAHQQDVMNELLPNLVELCVLA